MGRGSRRKKPGNVIAKRFRATLKAERRGALNRVLAKVHLLSGVEGFEELQHLVKDQLSKLSLNKRAAFVEEALAISIALGCDIWWLAGLSEHRELPEDVRRLREEYLAGSPAAGGTSRPKRRLKAKLDGSPGPAPEPPPEA